MYDSRIGRTVNSSLFLLCQIIGNPIARNMTTTGVRPGCDRVQLGRKEVRRGWGQLMLTILFEKRQNKQKRERTKTKLVIVVAGRREEMRWRWYPLSTSNQDAYQGAGYVMFELNAMYSVRST
jgi:hypothetical protein